MIDGIRLRGLLLIGVALLCGSRAGAADQPIRLFTIAQTAPLVRLRIAPLVAAAKGKGKRLTGTAALDLDDGSNVPLEAAALVGKKGTTFTLKSHKKAAVLVHAKLKTAGTPEQLVKVKLLYRGADKKKVRLGDKSRVALTVLGGPGGLNLEGSLQALGVDTAASARETSGGAMLTTRYNPLGKTRTFDRVVELVADGMTPAGTSAVTTLYETGTLDPTAAADTTLVPPRIDGTTAAESPWIPESRSDMQPAQTLRAVAAADVDGNGRDEVVTAYMTGNTLALHVLGDVKSGFAEQTATLGDFTNVKDVTVAGGDFDGDGRAELAIGLARSTDYLIVFVTNHAGAGFQVDQASQQSFPALLPASGTMAPSMTLHTGSVDFDTEQELLVVLNAIDGTTAAASFTLLDDAASGYAALKSGDVHGLIGPAGARIDHAAVIANGVLADIDGDNVDEVVFGGLETVTPGNDCAAAEYLIVALDDAVAGSGFAQLGAEAVERFLTTCDPGTPQTVRTVFVNALDVTRDGRPEVEINNFVYDYSVTDGVLRRLVTLPDDAFLQSGEQQRLDRTITAVATGDFTADGYDDVLVYREGTDNIYVWSIRQTGVNPDGVPIFDVKRAGRLPTVPQTNDTAHNPILVTANVDDDSPVFQSTDGSYKLVFSEPIVIAALAAPPCQEGIGQNTDDCVTTYGNTKSTSQDQERSLSVSASETVGVSLEDRTFTQSQFELAYTFHQTLTQTRSSAYSLSRSTLFTSGPLEDTVVFTTIPLDQYSYVILAHPDPAMVGKTIVVSLPRSVITLKAERGFYNSVIPDDSLHIAENVFTHHPGDVHSYPTAAQKNQLLSDFGGGLQHEAQSVGQGHGSTGIEVTVGSEVGQGQSLEIGYEAELKVTTGGVMGGFAIGSSTSDTVTLSSGSETTFSGTIGDLSRDLAKNLYSFGMFTYRQTDPTTHQQFLVVNFWVQ